MRFNYFSLLCTICILFFLNGCDESHSNKNINQVKEWKLPVFNVNSHPLPIRYKATGTVVSDQRIEVSSRATGYIKNILVLEGDYVSKGQKLVELDNSDVEGAIQQADAAVKAANLAMIDADIDVTKYSDLYKKGSISESQMRKIKLHRDRAKENLKATNTAYNIAVSQRQYIQISSEISGVVVTRELRNGDLATPRKSILTIESSQGLFFDTYVAESQISNIAKGAKVTVKIDALKQAFEGVVARIVPAVDPVTRRYKVKISLPNNNGLLSGMFGRVDFILGRQNALVVPKSALIERGGLKGVFVVNNKNEIHFRWLQTGEVSADFIEVRAGLKPDEQIILQAISQIKEGDKLISSDGLRNNHG